MNRHFNIEIHYVKNKKRAWLIGLESKSLKSSQNNRSDILQESSAVKCIHNKKKCIAYRSWKQAINSQ